ncbi:hypothetical protein SDC9_144026 [bioreactor metagenome]|uniref:Uncharacterized protein n=1 Tax=bioreactor metagenome TaxID=1076179 RepID=A0A645E5L1_9ZZZZ
MARDHHRVEPVIGEPRGPLPDLVGDQFVVGLGDEQFRSLRQRLGHHLVPARRGPVAGHPGQYPGDHLRRVRVEDQDSHDRLAKLTAHWKSTLMPSAQAFGVEYSRGLWLMPSYLPGTKTIPVGQIAAISPAS